MQCCCPESRAVHSKHKSKLISLKKKKKNNNKNIKPPNKQT